MEESIEGKEARITFLEKNQDIKIDVRYLYVYARDDRFRGIRS